MAAPAKFDQARAATIVQAISDGLPRRLAAELAGVTDRAVYYWLAEGRKAESGPMVQFFQAVKRAEAEFVQRNVKAIEKAGAQSWQAMAWLLERRLPEEFGSQRQEVAMLRKQVQELLLLAEGRNGKASGV